MNKLIDRIIRVIMVGILIVILTATFGTKADAATLRESPYVTISPNGKSWTVRESLPYTRVYTYYLSTGTSPEYWYSDEDSFKTGIKSSLPKVMEGQHLYSYTRHGNVPVGKWQVAHYQSSCVHVHDTTTWLGNEYTKKSVCRKAYYSGWFAICADCGGLIDEVFMYMSREAVHSIDSIDCDMGYFYQCPSCEHLENTYYRPGHSCKQLSWNSYSVKYDKNIEGEYVHMPDSVHMYNNAVEYEGKEVDPQRNLELNTYSRTGYVFTGWNTKPDGTGESFSDGQEIFNLCDGEGDVITLYAQWRLAQSSLQLETAEGQRAFWGDYGSQVDLTEQNVGQPRQYVVSFIAEGAAELETVVCPMVFDRWENVGELKGLYAQRTGTYWYYGPDGHIDRLRAVYSTEGIILPEPVREGYSFGGWYYDRQLTRLAGDQGELLIPTEDTVLYASWNDLKLFSQQDYISNSGKGAVDLDWYMDDGMDYLYGLLVSEDGEHYSRIYNRSVSGSEPKVREILEYSGTRQYVDIEYSGIYRLEAHGSEGSARGTNPGGRGGYVAADVYLNEGDMLSILVGGNNGDYGGGATIIESREKGIIMIAGGGGAACDYAPGGDGGAPPDPENEFWYEYEDHGTDDDGMGITSGGGGAIPGAPGEAIVHHHSSECMNVTTVSTRCGSTAFKETHEEGGWYWGNIYMDDDGNWRHDGFCPRCGSYTCRGHLGYERTTYTCKQCGKTYEDTKPSSCKQVCERQMMSLICELEEGQLISLQPSAGGSSIVMADATNVSLRSGRNEGQGSATVTGKNLGMTAQMEQDDVPAPDCVAPMKIDADSVRLERAGDRVDITFNRPLDLGTVYYHRVIASKNEALVYSNVVRNEMVTGVKGYNYYLDNGITGFADEELICIEVPSSDQYITIEPVDMAGNVGEEIRVYLQVTPLLASITTSPIMISSLDGDQGVYISEDGTIYVRADGEDSFILEYQGVLAGRASNEFQINRMNFIWNGGVSQTMLTVPNTVPYTDNSGMEISMMGRRITGEQPVLLGRKLKAYRSDDSATVHLSASFKADRNLSGNTITVMPGCSSVYSYPLTGLGEICSDPAVDALHGLEFTVDGDGPEIVTPDSYVLTEIPGEREELYLLFSASDAISGVRELVVDVYSGEDFLLRSISSGDGHNVTVVITGEDMASGNAIRCEARAIDNVGNKTVAQSDLAVWKLEAELTNLKESKGNLFKAGESGIIFIDVSGYGESVEVIFPEEMVNVNPDINDSYTLDHTRDGRVHLEHQFMVPLYTPPGDYVVKVLATKQSEVLEVDCPLRVEGSILEDFRTRLR